MTQNQQASYQRNHSFSKTPSLAQISSWIIFLTQALVFYIYIINQYQSTNLKASMTTIFTITLFSLVISAIYTGQTDPTDQLIIHLNNKNMQKVLQYRKEGKNIYFCSICDCIVKEKSRHCKVCNRCSQYLDHHCIWLNICVGSKNYRPFAVTITLTFFTFFFFVLSICLLTAQLYYDSRNFKTVGFIITWIVGVVIIVFLILITNLIVLHIYLNYKGLSTYEFILLRAQQKKKQQEELEKEKQRKKQQQKKSKAQIQKEQKTQQSIIDQKINKSINDTNVYEKTSRNDYEKQVQGSSKNQSLSNVQNEKFEKPKNQPYIKVDSFVEPTNVRLGPGDRFQARKNRETVKLNQSQKMIIRESERKPQTQSVFKPSQRCELNDEQFRLFSTKKKRNNKKISKFFLKNASFDLLFPGKLDYPEPHQDIIKSIELDQEIDNYKKNHSLMIESKQEEINSGSQQNYISRFSKFDNRQKSIHDLNIYALSKSNPYLKGLQTEKKQQIANKRTKNQIPLQKVEEIDGRLVKWIEMDNFQIDKQTEMKTDIFLLRLN